MLSLCCSQEEGSSSAERGPPQAPSVWMRGAQEKPASGGSQGSGPRDLVRCGESQLPSPSRRLSAGGRVWGCLQPNHSGSQVTFMGGGWAGANGCGLRQPGKQPFSVLRVPPGPQPGPTSVMAEEAPGHGRGTTPGLWNTGRREHFGGQPLSHWGRQARPGRFLGLLLALLVRCPGSLPTHSGSPHWSVLWPP